MELLHLRNSPEFQRAFLINTNFTADLPSRVECTLYIGLLGEHKSAKIYWAASPVSSYPRALLIVHENLLVVGEFPAKTTFRLMTKCSNFESKTSFD